jgi:hypothetical protein
MEIKPAFHPKRRGVSRNQNLTKDTLIKIAKAGIIIVAATTSPYFLHSVAKGYFKERIQKHMRARARKLRELEKKKFISFQELTDGKVRIELTHHGEKLIRLYSLDDMKLHKPKQWDNLWRILIYDIPVKHKKASDAFRLKLKSLGLYQLQKSVWVSPYECIAEIEFLCGVFDININTCINYFRSKEIPQEKKLRKHFDF